MIIYVFIMDKYLETLKIRGGNRSVILSMTFACKTWKKLVDINVPNHLINVNGSWMQNLHSIFFFFKNVFRFLSNLTSKTKEKVLISYHKVTFEMF